MRASIFLIKLIVDLRYCFFVYGYGLGRDGYSIVGQGKVDDILSHRSEDRRKIFEEASGIVKFKTRKEEAEKKLFNTDQNLIRINDIIQELSEQMEPLSEQAVAAKKYINLRDELQEIEIAFILDQADQLTERGLESEQEKRILEEDLAKQQAVLSTMRDDNRKSIDELHQLDEQLEKQRTAINNASLKATDLAGEAALGSERISQLRDRIIQGQQQIEESQESLSLLENDISGRQKKLDTLIKQKSSMVRGWLKQKMI